MSARRPAASVLDRLLDFAPDRPADDPIGATQAVREARASVRRDLEVLLNTQHRTDLPVAALPQLASSLLRFGTPGFHGLMLATREQQGRLAREIRRLIEAFEPRLADVSVELDGRREAERALHLKIRARLRHDDGDEAIVFDTRLDPAIRQFTVEA